MKKIVYTYLILILLGYSSKAQKPNVVLIVSDDHGFADISSKGVFSNLKTPNIDQLIKDGITFSNAYVTAPICSPSRCAIQTGTHQVRDGNYFYGGPGFKDGRATLAQGFKSLGYNTAYFGKLHYGKNDKPNMYGYPTNHGFDKAITGGVGGRLHYLYHNSDSINRKDKTAAPFLKDGELYEKDGFTTEIISEWTQEYIEENRDNPFFVQVSFNAVHNFNFQLPDKYLKEWNLEKYPDFHNLKTGETASQWYDRSIMPNLPNGRKYYIAQLYYLDREIGRIREKLKECGVDDNTIIIYISDNGGGNCNGGDNTPLRSHKYSLYEGGIKVPMVISWGDRFKGESKKMLVSSMDIMPTVLAAANAPEELYSSCDGVNLLPSLNGDKEVRETLFWDVEYAWAIRDNDWKLKVIRNQDKADKVGGKQHTDLGSGVELYNLKNDPSETLNIATKHPGIVKRLTNQHKDWIEQLNE